MLMILSRVIEIVSKSVAEYLKPLPESSFESLNVDSLEFLEIVQATEESFGVKLSDEMIGKIDTVKDLADAIEEAQP
jgi:acyl carrier protein